MANKKRLSVWGVLARLGHTGDHDEIVQHVFESASRVTLRGNDTEPLAGDGFLVEVFESLGSTRDWPACGSPQWSRLRFEALTQVVRRLGREGLLDCLSVGSEGTPAPSNRETGKPTDGEHDGGESDTTDARDGEGEGETPADKDEGLASDAIDGNDDTPAAKDDSPDPRVGVQAYRAMIRRGIRNPSGWFRLVNRNTPYRVIVRWAEKTCPGVATESLVALLDEMREVRWWDDDGHVLGAEMLQVLEAEIEEGCGNEQWMCVVSDFESAVGRLRSVFEKLSLL